MTIVKKRRLKIVFFNYYLLIFKFNDFRNWGFSKIEANLMGNKYFSHFKKLQSHRRLRSDYLSSDPWKNYASATEGIFRLVWIILSTDGKERLNFWAFWCLECLEIRQISDVKRSIFQTFWRTNNCIFFSFFEINT